MHEVIRRNCEGFGVSLQLMRRPTDDGGMIFAFRTGRNDPVWVARRGTGKRGWRRVQCERRALEWLLPWHAALRAPALLDVLETPEEIWVVQAGLCGQQRFIQIGPSGQLPAEILTAIEWLHQFQHTVAAPVDTDVTEVARAWARDAAVRPDGWSEPLWQQVQSFCPVIPAVATHGDFWVGNLLFERSGMSVIDWNTFHAGNPLDDLLTLFMTLPRQHHGHYLDRMECFLASFFTPGPALNLLQAWTRRRGVDARAARFCFYLYLARRIRWEFGFGLQSRSWKSIEQSQRFWKRALKWLSEQHFPDPFSCPPRPENGWALRKRFFPIRASDRVPAAPSRSVSASSCAPHDRRAGSESVAPGGRR